MIFIPILALVAGIFLPSIIGFEPLTDISGMYFGVACLAGLDSVCGGIRTGLEGKFQNVIFITGFLSNIVIAFVFAWLGDQIGVDLFLATVLVMGWRVYTNLSLIRRYYLTKLKDARERSKRQQQQQAQTNA